MKRRVREVDRIQAKFRGRGDEGWRPFFFIAQSRWALATLLSNIPARILRASMNGLIQVWRNMCQKPLEIAMMTAIAKTTQPLNEAPITSRRIEFLNLHWYSSQRVHSSRS